MELKTMYTKISKENMVEIARQYKEAFRFSPWDLDLIEVRICEYMSHPHFRGYVYLENDVVVSAALGMLQQYYDGLRYQLTDLFTAKEYQNRGHASSLLDYIKKSLKEEGVTQIMLTSLNDDLHNHFYNDKNGFETRTELCIKRFYL